MNYIIDRLEGAFAVIELENGLHVDLPRSLVPAGAKEGDALFIGVDAAATEERKRKIAALMDDLFADAPANGGVSSDESKDDEKNVGLLLIDIQNDYFPGGRCELHEPQQAAARAGELLAFFRNNALPVFHVRHVSLDRDAAFFLPDTYGAEICEGLTPADGEPVFVKHAPDSFCETGLQEALQKAGVRRLAVCGMMTHMCVDTTVRAARGFGYRVSLISDACACKELQWQGTPIPAETVQQAFLAAMDGSFAEVLSTADCLRRLAAALR